MRVGEKVLGVIYLLRREDFMARFGRGKRSWRKGLPIKELLGFSYCFKLLIKS